MNPAQDPANPLYQMMQDCGSVNNGEEWVEIYNTSRCDTVNLGCYIIASKTSATNGGAFAFSAGTLLPPLAFITVGGPNSNADIKLTDLCSGGQVCSAGTWSLPNDFGWIALYNPDGDVMDAIYWTETPGQGASLGSNAVYDNEPCAPSGCSSGSLKRAADMSPSTEISYAGKAPLPGTSIYRTIDGTGGWQTDGIATPGNCNGVCVIPSDLNVTIEPAGDERCLQQNGHAKANVSGGILPFNFDWSNSANADSIFGLAAGNYTVTVIDAEGCISIASVDLINIGVPVDVIIEPDAITIFQGEGALLEVVSDAAIVSYDWGSDDGLSCTDCAIPSASPEVTTQYTVTVIDADGCTGTATARVSVLTDQNSVFVATAFTPNNDMENDVLYIRSPRIAAVDFHIYDRWGKEVFYTNDQTVGWDGRDKSGKELNAGVYVYFAEVVFDNGKTRLVKGNVALLR